ncbi:glycosyl hydrolase 115 family protein [Bacillus sp. PS06]|uniref:glycosyl hydrolase 115 family protein n=1 Tax=Bacillus sp. PS06 TaxID=2764176 RepID=UPI001785C849|nr:glycosyl hydrolase 115 family protein [Bacillus sp. PS06]MBD8068693.1 glycosyl hydrolase 115 family protein [Bacillus sp. PS06]
MNPSKYFIFSKDTRLDYQGPELKGVSHFLNVLTRDKNKVLQQANDTDKNTILFVLHENEKRLKEEQYEISFADDLTEMKVSASDELGMIYGILHVSEQFLGVDKFWFWNDLEPEEKSTVSIRPIPYLSTEAKVRFRGWFINDEVLISTWKYQNSNSNVWEMVFESLLRCHGNMVIPGTDIENPVYKNIAIQMGLWVTHHHAEPLGAQMFSRIYPDKKASYIEHKELFQQLWKEAILEQKDAKVIWNIGFRGQGDRPFWIDDPTFDTDEKRGALISEIMRDQYELIASYQDDPICCVNLYGEITELYKKGLLELPEGVIKIWADSGYGKMVTRRQGDHNPRVPSLASTSDKGPHGIYYHVTFYDLQASNHLTMLPNTTSFVEEELKEAFEHNMSEFLIVNCGNVRPHLYYLDFVSKLWSNGNTDSKQFQKEYVSRYYPSYSQQMSEYLNKYLEAIIQYGGCEDERAGEQFYHFAVRKLAHQWIASKGVEPAKDLFWATGQLNLNEQFKWFQQKVEGKVSQWETLLEHGKSLVGTCEDIEQKRIHDQFLLQVQIHKNGCKALYSFSKAFERFQANDYLEAFVLVNEAMKEIDETLAMMENPTITKWKGFHDNDCLTNISLTYYSLETLRRYIRIIGDSPSFYTWEKQYLTSEREKTVMLLTNKTKQLTDDELINRLLEK